MPIIKNEALSQNLAGYDVYIEDTSQQSDYFRVTKLPPEFTGGRNSFLIAGSNFLENGSQIKIEIVDAKGKPVYQSMVRNYTEGTSKMITVEVYDDTAPGFATITIMGKATVTSDGKPFPPEWRGVYNVRWTKTISIDYFLKNQSTLVFKRQPSVLLEEKKFYNITSASYETVNIPFTASLTPLLYSSFQVGYGITAEAPSTFSADLSDGKFTGSIIIDGVERTIDIPITSILNKTTAFSDRYLIESPVNDGIIRKIYLRSGSYTTNMYSTPYNVTSSVKLQYSTINSSNINIPISYASLRVFNLDTVSGEIYKFRVYSKVATNTADYKLVGDVYVKTEELLVSSSVRGDTPIGDVFLTPNYQDNWYAGSLTRNTGLRNRLYTVSGSATYYNSGNTSNTFTVLSNDDILLSSIYASVPIDTLTNKFSGQVSESGYFIGTKDSYTVFPTSEYTLQFDAFYKSTSSSITLVGNTPKVDIYLIGTGSVNVLDNNPLGQKVGELTVVGDVARYQTKQFNFTPAISTAGEIGLRFVVSNGFWNFSNISLKPASDPQFAPDETVILIPNTEYHNQLLQYKVEFFDINNNSTTLNAISIPTFFTGSAIDMGTLP